MTNDQTIQQPEVVEAPVNIETVTEVTIDPIYRHKDGRIFTKKQLIAKMGLTEDRIKDGLNKGMITQVGDTDDPEQQFKHKDGRVFSMKDFAGMGVDKDRLATGIEKGMIVPIEKKSQVVTTPPPLETQQPKPEVSSTGVAVGESVSTTPPPAEAEVAVTTEVVQAPPPPVVEEVKTDFSVAPLEKTKEAVQLQAPLQAQQSNLIVKNDEGQDQPAIITNPNEPVPSVEESTKFWDSRGVKKTPDINIFDNASQYEKLKTAKKKVVLNDGGIPDLGGGAYEAEVDDEEATKRAKEIKQEGLSKKIDYDAVATIGKQVNEYYQDPVMNKQVKQELSEMYLSGDLDSFNRRASEITFLNQLVRGLGGHFNADETIRITNNLVSPYYDLFKSTLKESPDGVVQIIQGVGGNKIPIIQSVYNNLKSQLEFNNIENKEEILDNFRKMVSRDFANQAINHPEYIEVDPLANSGLDENQIIGFNYTSAVAPEELGKYRAALIPDSDIGDNWKAKTAKQQALKALTQIGINVVAPTVNEKLKNEIGEYNDVVTAFNKNYYFDATPDFVNEMIGYLGEREKRINRLSSMSSRFDRDLTNLNDDSKYGYANYYERQGLLQELTEQRHGAIAQPLLQLGRSVYNTGATLVDLIKRPFLSDKENEVNLATLLGTNIVLDNELKVAQRNQMEKVPYVMTPTFQSSYDDIMNNKSLSDEDKQNKVYDLIVSDPNGIQADVKGKESNLTLSSLWYGMTNLAADLAPYLLVEAMTGGTATGGVAPTVMKKFSSSFIAAFTTGFHQSYIDAISRGSKNPYQDAMRATAISSLAMAGAGTPSIMKNIIGTKSVIGKMVNKMTDKEINAVLRKQPPALLAFRKAYDITGKVAGATKEGFKGGVKMVTLTTAAAAINDQMYGDVRDIEEYIDGGKLEVLKFTLFGGITGGIARGFKEKYGDLTKSTLYEAAANPKKFLEALEIKIKNNELSKEDADQIRNNIEQASKIYKSTYFGFTPQKMDAKAQKEQYDALIKQGVSPEAATKAVAELVQKKAQEQPLDDAGKRNLLFLKMQEADLEKTLKDNLPEAQTKKLTNRLLNIKEQINDLRNGIEAPEREQTTIDVLIRGEVIPGDIIKNKTGGVAKVVKVNENKSVLVENLNTGEKFLWKPEDIETEIIEPPREVKPIPVLGPPKPPEPVVEKQTQKQKAPEPDSDIMVSDVIDKGGSYNGKRGIFYLEDQTVVFKEEGTGKEYDLGYINDIKDTPINQYGIKHEESVVSANEDGTFTIRGKVLRNGYSDPTQAVVKDTEGNIVSVTLDMPNGQKRTFKGNVAEDIAYQIHLKEITKDNATTTEFEEFINEPDTKQQIDNATVPATTETSTVTTNEPVQRETLQPTAAEPATTSTTIEGVEREVIVKRMKPFTDKMVEIEREFQNEGYEIDTDYDNEITVTDKDGELVEAEDLPKNLRERAGQYEALTAKLGEFDESARNLALKESREITEVEAEVVTPEKKQIESPEEKSILTSKTDLKGDKKQTWMLEATERELEQSKLKNTPRGAQFYPKKISDIERAIKQGKYESAIEEGRMTAQDAKQIIESAGLETPKTIEDLVSKNEPTERVTETQQVSTTRNTIAPKGVKQGGLFPGNRTKPYDATKEYPELTKYNDENLNTASAADMWNLLQMSHPKEYGFSVSRNAMLDEFSKRGKQIFEELGLPTDGDALYKNNYTDSVVKLSEQLDEFGSGNEWAYVAQDWNPIFDYKKEIELKQKELANLEKEREGLKSKDKNKKRSLDYHIKDTQEEIELLKENAEKNTKKTTEAQRVFTAAELKENPDVLKEDPDNNTIGYPDSFVKMGTNVATLKGEGFGEAKVGDVITFSGKEYVVKSIEASKKDPNKARVTLLRVDKDGKILREKDLSKKEQKELMATEEEPAEIEAGSEIEFKTVDQKTTKGIKIEIPGMEAIDTILVQDGMVYEVYELATGMKLGDTESAMSPADAVKTIADKMPKGIAEKILQKLYESEETGRYSIAGEKKGVSITNESPAYNVYKQQKIAEAENRPFASDENTRNELLKMAVQARADGYADAASMIESMANQRAGTAAAPFTVEQAKETLNKFRVKRDLAYRKTENIPFPKSEIEERDPSEQGLVNAIQRGYTRDRWNNLPDEIKNAALEAWKKESAIYNKYGYYPSSFKGGENFFGVMLTLGRYIGATLSKDPAKREGKVQEDLRVMKENFKRIDEIYKEEGFDVLKAEEGQTPKPLTVTETPLPDGARAAFDRIKNRQQQNAETEPAELLTDADSINNANDLIKNDKIEGGLLNDQQSLELQKEIESNYSDSGLQMFGQNNRDIRQNLFNYDNPLAEKDVNGVNLRIAEGLIEGEEYSGKRRKTYLLYADGKIVGKFYSVSDIKKVVKIIEDNLIKKIGQEKTKTVEQLRAEEQAKLDEAIPNAEQYRVDGKVDRSKLTNKKDIEAFDKIYNEYDILITPLLKEAEATTPEVEMVTVSGNVVNFPTNEIKTNTEEYQGRKTLFSERSAKNVAENFDINKFDPIVIYKHPDGNTYVLSGHSRLEGMKRRGEPTIPARVFEGTPEQAKDFALKSNKLGSLQTDIENAAYYRNQLQSGKSYNAIMAEAKENEQAGSAKKIVSYAYLNPNGKTIAAMESLQGSEGDSASNLSAIASKIGDIRAKNEHLTDAHENELFDYMVADKNNIPTDKELQDPNSQINRSIAATRFNAEEPLNLNKFTNKSPERTLWEKEKRDLEEQISSYKKEVNANKTTGWSGLKERAIASLATNKSKEAIDRALEDFNNDKNGIKNQYEKILSQKKAELKGLEDKLAKHLLREKDLIEGERGQQSLFSYQETAPKDFEDYVEGVTDMLKESPEKTLQQIQAQVARDFGNNTPEFKKLIEQAYNEAKNNLTSRIVKTEVLQKLNKGFLKIGTTIFDNEMQLLNKAKELSGSRFNAIENTAGFETRDGKPLGFNYDTDQVARERFDFSKLNKIGEGSDRIVFDLGNGKVLKVAKTARGLEQNIYEGDGYLDFIPEIYERGLNYVVVENINRIKGTDLVPIFDVETGQEIGTVTAAEMFRDLKKFGQRDFDQYNPKLQTVLEKYGFADARGYKLLYGDFNVARNWGFKDGKAYLIDAGTLGGVRMIEDFKGVKNLSDPDFRKIYYESRNLKKQYADKDKYTKFHYDENGEILGFTHGGQIYLNGQKITAKTTMEEAGHIWINNARETNPNLYKAGLKKVVNSQYLKDVMSSAFYKKEAKKQGPEGSKAYNDYMQEEALAKAIADEGAKFVTDAQRISFKDWVDKMWNSVMQAFGIRDLSSDQVAKLSLQDFAKMAAADVFAETKAEAPAPETAPPLVTTTPVSETVTTSEVDGKITTTTTTQTPTGERITRTESFNTDNPFLYEGTEERQRGLYTHLMDADNVSGETKDFFKKNGITYQAASNAQAEVLATDIIKAVGKRDALQIARGSDVHASIRSAIYARSIDNAYVAEANAKTPQEKMRAAQEWKDLVTEYANQLTAGGQFTSYAAHFYRTSPMGFVIKENEDRAARFDEWSKGKEKTLEELWSEINATAEGRSMVNLEVDKIRKAEKEAERKIRDKKIDDFFDQLKVNPKNTYGFIIPLSVLNPVIDGMKIAVKAGDRIADVVKTAIDQISEKVGDNWNKEAFRKDYEQMLTNVVGKQKTLSDEAVQLKNRVTGLEKQIADLKEKIAAGGEPGKKKEAKFSDNPEVQALIEERDRLKKENEDLLKDAKEGKYSDEAKIKAAKQRVVDAINETQRKIDENDLAVKRKTNPTDAELTAYREEQKRLRKELEDMRKDAQEGKYSPIEMAKAEAKRKQARIDELNRRINESDFSAEKQKMQKQKTALDVELEDTKKRYDEAKKQSPEFKEKKSAQFLDRLRKRLQGLSERERNEIVQRSLKQITEAGGLNYEEFRKIVAESMGYRDLTPAEVKEVESLTETINSVDEAEDNLVNNPTEANLKALDNARQNAMVAGLKLYNKTHRPADIPRTFGSLITGSLLGVVTLGKNIIQNVVMQATVRLPKAVIIQPTEAALSWLGNKMAGSKVFNPSTNIFLAQKGAYKGGGRGIKRGWFNFYKGTQERDYFSKTSYQSTLAPIEAVRDLKLYFSGEKPLTKTELFERSIRATIGWQPDFILRSMGFGDRPFRWAAEGSAAIQIAKLELKLTTDNEVNAFMYAPKKYAYKTLIEQGVPKEEAIQRAAEIEDRIIDAGSKAVLEQENALSRVSKWMDQGLATKKDDPLAKRIGFGALSILKTTTFPFVKIPANVYWQMFKVANPEVALLQGIYHGTKAAIESKNGNKAEAKRQYENMKDGMATAVLGYGAMVAISSLVANGYVRPENDEETKAREREGEKVYEKGNQLNWGRMTGGEDFWIDLSWFGPIGTTMAVQAKIQEQNRRKKLKGEEVADSWAEGLVERLSVAQMEALTNLVYDQASRTIGAVKGGAKPLQVWTVNTMNTGMNLFTGATYVQMSKATLPLVPRLKAEGIMEEFKNNQKQRNILYRMYSGMPPSRVSIWGDPIKQNTSFGGVVSNMLGFQETDAHQFGAILYYDAQRTGDTRFFPTPVTDKITVDGVEVKLTQDQKDELATYVGQARATLVGSFVYGMSFLYRIPVKGGEAKKVSYNDKDMTDADKIHSLEMIYEQGKRSGFAKFQQMHKEFAPAVLTAEELGKQIKREVYDYDFKMNLEKTLINEGKTIPTPNKEEELQKEIDELNEQAKKQFEENNPE